MPIRCGHCKGNHDTVADVRVCSQKTKGEWVMGGAKPAEPREITEGLWYLGDGDRIIKVQRAVHGSQHLYTKELVREEPARGDDGEDISPGSWSFQRLYGGMKMLRTASKARKMTLEEAAEFGKLYGVCCRCGRTLTDEESIALGIGPVCKGMF